MSGAKSDAGDAHVLADMVRTDAHQLRLIAADSPAAQAVKVVARAHKTLIWERSRQVHRLRYQLRDFFPAALEAYPDLDAPDVLELLAKAPEGFTPGTGRSARSDGREGEGGLSAPRRVGCCLVGAQRLSADSRVLHEGPHRRMA